MWAVSLSNRGVTAKTPVTNARLLDGEYQAPAYDKQADNCSRSAAEQGAQSGCCHDASGIARWTISAALENNRETQRCGAPDRRPHVATAPPMGPIGYPDVRYGVHRDTVKFKHRLRSPALDQ